MDKTDAGTQLELVMFESGLQQNEVSQTSDVQVSVVVIYPFCLLSDIQNYTCLIVKLVRN